MQTKKNKDVKTASRQSTAQKSYCSTLLALKFPLLCTNLHKPIQVFQFIEINTKFAKDDLWHITIAYIL